VRPILSDSEYINSPFWINRFEPYRRELMTRDEENIPVLITDDSGKFIYESLFDPESFLRFSIMLEGGPGGAADFRLFWKDPEEIDGREIFRRKLILSDTTDRVETGLFEIPIPVSNSGQRKLIFDVEIEGKDIKAAWINPVIINHNKTLKLIVEEGNLMAFENTEALERSRIVHQVITVESDAEAAEVLSDASGYDPRTETILFQDVPWIPARAAEGQAGTEWTEVVKHHHEYVRLEAELSRPGWLVLADTYYPGWRALVDGEEQRIYRADLTFRGLYLEPGHHEIFYWFQPWDFQIGLWTSLASILSIILILAFKFLYRPKKIIHE
jgi:hypothetical protein